MRPRLLIFCTLYDSDHPAFADGGTVYTGYLCKCHRCSGAGVSDICAGFIRSIVTQVYFSQSAKIIPITILVALWSAGRGVLSVTAGLNCIYGNTETRNYVYLRLRASLYNRDLHSCNRTVTGSVCIWKQYQRHDLQACTVLEYSDAVYYLRSGPL